MSHRTHMLPVVLVAISTSLVCLETGRGDDTGRGAEPVSRPMSKVPSLAPKLPDGITVQWGVHYREGNPSWNMNLAMPKDLTGKLRPAIVIIHGGGWIEGDASSFSDLNVVAQQPAHIVNFAKAGFVAVAINYRLSGEAPFPAAVEDCKCAVRWLRAHAKDYHIDADHVGAWGNSAGGHLALLLGMVGRQAGMEGEGPYLDQSSMVQAVVSDAGPVDLDSFYRFIKDKRIVVQFLSGPKETFSDRLKKASPITYVSSCVPPLMILQGCADPYVSPEETDRFVAKLQKVGAPDLTYLRLGKVGHCPHSIVRVPYLQEAVVDFFTRTLTSPQGGAHESAKK
jgi:acetyl esterase/lipase